MNALSRVVGGHLSREPLEERDTDQASRTCFNRSAPLCCPEGDALGDLGAPREALRGPHELARVRGADKADVYVSRAAADVGPEPVGSLREALAADLGGTRGLQWYFNLRVSR